MNAVSASAWVFVGTAWNATFDTGNPESTQAVATDTQDNVIITGIVNQDFVTVKFNSAGVQQWNDTYDISGIGSTDQARGVAADSSDNVYVTGNGGSPQNIATVKYTSGGVRVWTSFYNSGASFESGRDVVVDSQGDIIITGYGGSAPDFITIKYNTTGGQQWVSTLDIGSHDQARGIAVDSQDNIVVAGQSNVSGANDFIVVKYNSAGIQLWNTTFDTGFPDSVTGVAVDSTDNIYVSGYQTTSAQREDYVTVKFNSSGSYVWNQTINKSLRDIENGVAVDNNDNVIVTGQSGVGGAYDYFTMFFYPNSTQQFNMTFDAGDDIAVDVATDSQNSILVAGLSDSVSASGNDDYFVLKYLINPSCGQVLTGDTVLNQDLNCTGSAAIINSSDLVFDCNGHSINGPGTGIGIKVLDNGNITVRNCGINSFATGVDVDPSWNVTIENSSFANMTTCVYINQSNWTLVKNNTFYNCSYAVRVLTGSYNNITDNTINLTGEGILLELNSLFNTIHANQIYNISLFGSNKGIHVKRSHNTTVSNNLVQDGKAGAASAIDIDRENVFQAQNNTVRNNIVINAGPIVMSGTRWNLAEFNNITQSTGMCLWIDERYHEIRNNTFYNCSTDGIDLSSGYNNVSGNIIWGNGDDGIDINSDVNNSVFRNTVYNNTGNGIIIDNGVDDHDLINNTVYGNGRNGVLIQAAGGPGTDNRVIGNEIYNNSLNGVYLFQVNQEFVLDNNISSNGLAGIALANTAAFNNISGNTVKNHTYSINLTNADFNTIYNNYFEDIPAADAASTNNKWNITKTLGTNIINGPFLGGNFWENYYGVDIDGDGLGDTFLPWRGDNTGITNGGDYHPLTSPAFVVAQQVILNSTFGTNYTSENLTCYANATTQSGGNLDYQGVWFKDNLPQFNKWYTIFGNKTALGSDTARDVVVDSNDNMIITGPFNVPGKSLDAFVAKYSSNGTQLWNASAGGNRSELSNGVTVDSQDAVIAVGYIQINSQKDILILKYDENGTALWNVTLGDPAKPEEAFAVATDSQDNVIVTGFKEPAGCSGCKDIYILKYNSTGSQLWTKIISAPGFNSSEGKGVAVDSQDNFFVAGYIRFGGPRNLFLGKFNSSGGQLRNVTYNSSSAVDVVTDDIDDVFVTGSGNGGIWTLRFTSNLAQRWNSTFISAGSSAASLAVDNEDSVYITGNRAQAITEILLLKLDSSGNKDWNFTEAFGVNDQGRGIDLDSKNSIVIGGRSTNATHDVLLLKYSGFELLNQTEGVLVNVSTKSYALTSPGDVWRCDVRGVDQSNVSYYSSSNNLTVRDLTPAEIQCSRNAPNNFTNCSNLQYFDNITQVRVNCSAATSARFNLTNVYDGTAFFVNTTTNLSGGWLVLDNQDVQVLDSGKWGLTAECDFGPVNGSRTENFTIPFGNITNAQMLSSSQSVNNGQTFSISTSIGCTGGECVNITAALDPIQPFTNLTQPTDRVHSVYADSGFIYGASQDNSLYVWNKTSLSLFTTLNDTNALLVMHADDEYIYAGGKNSQILIWNRTDIATPFAGVYNITGLGFDIVALTSNDDYLFAGVKFVNDVLVFNKSHPTFQNFINLTGPTQFIRGFAIDSNFLYAGSHDSNVYVFNLSNLSQAPTTLGTCSAHNVKAVSQDSNYIYSYSHDFTDACLLVWHKSNYSVKANLSFSNTLFLAGYSGGPDFAYAGGLEDTFTNGTLVQVNKTAFTVADRLNISAWYVKSLYCDESYLYAGMMDNAYAQGMVRLFNNSCGPAPAPVTISNVSITPANFPVTTNNVRCRANVTTPGTVANVTFNITFPDGSSILTGSTNVGNIYFSQGFTVSSTSDHNCTVLANNTNGSSASRTKSFFGGHKGIIPMNAGSPFYTTSQNPRNGSHQACLNSLIPGQNCTSAWNVVANGNPGDTWAFFTIYTGSGVNTSKINITILGGPGPSPSGGGGGGGATRAWQQEETQCIESWVCEPWSECKFGEMTRTCVDLNACGTTGQKPPESMSCKEEVVEEPAAVIEEKGVEKVRDIEHGPTTVVESPEPRSWNDIFSDRNFLRAALLVLVAAILVYLFALSGWLSKRPVVKRDRMSEAAFKPKKPPEKLPEDTEGLLEELGKL